MILRPLLGKRVATTRDEPGRLDELLTGLGAEVVHVPLIEIVDADGDELGTELAAGGYDWLIVTSHHGAARVGPRLPTEVRTAAVGVKTAEVLSAGTGRAVDVVPSRQTAAELLVAMPDPTTGSDRVLLAQADRAEPLLAEGLRARGYVVRTVVAYRTVLRQPTADELAALRSVDAVLFASGSAVHAWADVLGVWAPPDVVVIGPSTEKVARQVGLVVTAVADEHSVEGLAAATTLVLAGRP